MQTKKLILGASAAFIAMGSAIGSHSFLQVSLWVRDKTGNPLLVTTPVTPNCFNLKLKCYIRVFTANGGTLTMPGATIVTAGNTTVPGHGYEYGYGTGPLPTARTLGD